MAPTMPGEANRESAGTLSSWAELIQSRFTALSITPHDRDDVRGTVVSHQIGPLQAASVRSSPQRFVRTAASAAADTHGLLAVGLVEQGVGHLEQDGRACTLAAGQFALYDTTRPFSWAMDGANSWNLRVYTWPYSSLHYTDSDTEPWTARPVTQDSGIGGLLAPMLLRLANDGVPDLAAPNMVRLSAEIAEMAVIAASHADPDGDLGPPDRDLLQRAQCYIEENLEDPELGPEKVAAEFFVSVRTLHRLFARRDLTVSAWIKSRRLEACRRALCSPGASRVPIREVARRYGFIEASRFSKEFARRYGESPRQWRRHHELLR